MSAVTMVRSVEEKSSHTAPEACGADVGLGMQCRRVKGHSGLLHTWDPKRLLGEEPVPVSPFKPLRRDVLSDEKDVAP